jgi:cyclopropane fatty-acyl-phospholipid synthase-like methyltransferase
MPDRIETGTPAGDALGFYEEFFSGWLEIYADSRMYLHYIISRHKNEHHTQQLLEMWIWTGYDVRVVLPRPIMRHILIKFGFEQSSELLADHYEDEVEVWRRPLKKTIDYYDFSSQLTVDL